MRHSSFVVIHRGRKVLLVKPRGKRRWSLPGGGIKPRETPWDAALREAEEETGLRPELVGLSGMYLRRDGSLAYVFAGRVKASKEPGGPRHEIRKQRFMGIRKALEKLAKAARTRLLDALGLRVKSMASVSKERFALKVAAV